MPQTRRHPILAASVIAAIMAGMPPQAYAAAQQRQQQPARVETSREGVEKQPTRLPPTVEDASHTRQELEDLLRKYPVGRVLKLDPSLMHDDAYLASFPPLAEFLKEHPEIAHNPSYYFQNVRVGDEYPQPSASERTMERLMEGLSVVFGFGAVAGFFVWLIKTVLDQRRWNRLSRIQAEVHSKLLDRFSSNEEVSAYMQTPSGQRFLESGPSPLQEQPPALAAPVSRILWSVQAGIIVLMGGFGMLLVSRRFAEEPGEVFVAMGILAVALGAGFVISAGVAYVLSRRLGLFDRTATDHA